MKMSTGTKSWKWVGLMAVILAFTILVTDPAFAQNGNGDNPGDCDWEALLANAIVRRDDRIGSVGFDEGLVTADPEDFTTADSVTFTLDGDHSSTDNIVFIADIDCAEIGGGDGWDYAGPAGATELNFEADVEFGLGLWGFIDDDDDTLHGFTVLENGGGPTGPNLSLNVEGATYAEAGGSITMTANETMLAPYQWAVDGGDIGGATNATLTLSPTTTGDSGLYTLDFDDGVAKATLTSNGVGVAIFEVGTLPVGGLIGLALLSTGLLAGGVSFARRKKA